MACSLRLVAEFDYGPSCRGRTGREDDSRGDIGRNFREKAISECRFHSGILNLPMRFNGFWQQAEVPLAANRLLG
jgi:hypothetical protein